jgi:hypothetical protein
VSNMPSPAGWRQRVLSALVLLLAIALGARVAANLLAPLVPGLVILLLLIGLWWFLLGRRR